jgi:hypothetical protein
MRWFLQYYYLFSKAMLRYKSICSIPTWSVQFNKCIAPLPQSKPCTSKSFFKYLCDLSLLPSVNPSLMHPLTFLSLWICLHFLEFCKQLSHTIYTYCSFFFKFIYLYVHTLFGPFLHSASPPPSSPPNPLASRQNLFFPFL